MGSEDAAENAWAEMRRELDRRELELETVRSKLEAATRERSELERRLSARVRALEQDLSVLTVGLSAVRKDLENVARSRTWRYGHATASLLSRLRGRPPKTAGAVSAALRRIEYLNQGKGESPGDFAALLEGESGLRQSERRRRARRRIGNEAEMRSARGELAAEIRRRLGPAPQREEWPSVSIIVPTRNGLDHLRQLLDGLLRRTSYPSLELVVVDGGSTDGSVAWLRALSVRFPVHVLANEGVLTFAEACNQGADAATGDLLLFLNNDVEPFDSGWLEELVTCRATSGAAIVGATLLHAREAFSRDGAEWPVQHRGIVLVPVQGLPRPVNVDDGVPLLAGALGTDRPSLAVTGACLMVAAERFSAMGAFHTGYRFGLEDVDLCLEARTAGADVVCSGRSVLFHAESATLDLQDRELRKLNRLVNVRTFFERWGPTARRIMHTGVLRGDSTVTVQRPHVAITISDPDPRAGYGDWYTAHELGEALEERGWRVSYVSRARGSQPGLDDATHLLLLVDDWDLDAIPDHVVKVAWLRNKIERWLSRPWLDRVDVLLAGSPRIQQLVEQSTGRRSTIFPLATNPERFRLPSRDDPTMDAVFCANFWGERRALQSALTLDGGRRISIYGSGWERAGSLEAYLGGPVEYDRLPAIYSAARVALDDAASSTAEFGCVNSRVFDALACGTVVVSNQVAGVRQLFGDDFPVWHDAATLKAQLDVLLSDDARRRQLAERFRSTVLAEHTYAARAELLESVLADFADQPTFCLKIGAPNWEVAERWGDLHFARGFGRALRRRGHPWRVQVLREWDDPHGLADDVVVHLKGLSVYRPQPGQRNVLWSISHPERLSLAEAEGYDLVCVASERFADRLAAELSVPVVFLEQATDPSVFFPEPSPDVARELVFVGNSRGVMRRLLADLLPTRRDLAVWGGGWEGLIDQHLIVGEYLPPDAVRRIYSSADIVLNDHWPDMREHGFVSNRIYDALACNAVIVSDHLPELGERFGGAVATYQDATALAPVIDALQADPEAARQKAADGRERVLAYHTFDHRVTALLAALAGLKTDRKETSRVAFSQRPSPCGWSPLPTSPERMIGGDSADIEKARS